ncbi:MAG: cytochrome c [Paracoccaceae bacterium]|uniref:cytochrome c n=1 Tax=Yoonia sp. TaxID=2212373 RepID=UPI003274CFC5
MTGLGAAGLWMTRPQTVPNDFLASARHDAERGRLIFAAMGCASCHMAPGSEDQAILSGGRSFPSDFGTFYAPNISSDRQMGIGAWSDREIATAVLKGTAPDNSHYYPAFPYASYEQVAASDVADLIAHLRSLPADQTPSRAHDVGFPFNIRATLGGWKWFFTGRGWVIEEDLTPEQERGRMLVEAMGHCGECHTPRNILGGMDRTAWLAGAPIPGEEGRTPDLRTENLEWSQGDIVAYLKTGLTPDYDSAGGEMVDVIANTSQLPDADLEAIAAYLLIVPGVD